MATTTITTTGAQDARIAPALGRYLRLSNADGSPRNATGAEVKALLIDTLTSIVRSYEYANAQAAVAEPTLITPT